MRHSGIFTQEELAAYYASSLNAVRPYALPAPGIETELAEALSAELAATLAQKIAQGDAYHFALARHLQLRLKPLYAQSSLSRSRLPADRERTGRIVYQAVLEHSSPEAPVREYIPHTQGKRPRRGHRMFIFKLPAAETPERD